MMTDRGAARAIGVLFVVGTVAGALELTLVQQRYVNGSEYLTKMAAHENQVATGALLTLVMGVALLAMSIVISPILRRHSERLALGYVVARTVEGVFYVAVWGLVGAALYLVAGVLVIYGLKPLSATQAALEAPLGVQEMLLALWLIVKGFNHDQRPIAVPSTDRSWPVSERGTQVGSAA